MPTHTRCRDPSGNVRPFRNLFNRLQFCLHAFVHLSKLGVIQRGESVKVQHKLKDKMVFHKVISLHGFTGNYVAAA